MSWFHSKEPKEAGALDKKTQETKGLRLLESGKDPYIYVQSIMFKNGNKLTMVQCEYGRAEA